MLCTKRLFEMCPVGALCRVGALCPLGALCPVGALCPRSVLTSVCSIRVGDFICCNSSQRVFFLRLKRIIRRAPKTCFYTSGAKKNRYHAWAALLLSGLRSILLLFFLLFSQPIREDLVIPAYCPDPKRTL